MAVWRQKGNKEFLGGGVERCNNTDRKKRESYVSLLIPSACGCKATGLPIFGPTLSLWCYATLSIHPLIDTGLQLLAEGVYED